MAGDSLDARLDGLAALAEPVRRRLYRFVVTHPEPVSRDVAAEGIGVARHVAKFHLDRLVSAGLLQVEYRRPPGRRGPGAGRPTKLYSRSPQSIEVTVPERRYELAARFLAAAVTDTDRAQTGAAEALGQVARNAGRALGEDARRRAGARPSRAQLLVSARAVLDDHGYDTRKTAAGVTMVNCPFAALAADYTELVCGMNLDFVNGLLVGLAIPKVAARLDPGPDRCCVVLAP
jgi:predicted ArsR family transcriptional regulator